jgi:hypothetical protein
MPKQQNHVSKRNTVLNHYTDKKENKIFLIYKEIQKGAVAKSYMTNGLLIFRKPFLNVATAPI